MKKLISSKTTHQPPTSFLFSSLSHIFQEFCLFQNDLFYNVVPFGWLDFVEALLFSSSFFLVLNETFKVELLGKTVNRLKTVKYFQKNLHLRCLIASQSGLWALINFVYQLIFRWKHLCSCRDLQNPMINFGW